MENVAVQAYFSGGRSRYGLGVPEDDVTRLIPILCLLTACEPPPAPELAGDAAPSIQLIYPSPDAGVLPLDPDGRLSLLVAVEIRDLTFVTPDDANTDVDGEGHYHVTLNGEYVGAPAEQAFEYTSAPDQFSVGQGLALRVSLQTNTHLDLDDSERWEDIAEYVIGAAP